MDHDILVYIQKVKNYLKTNEEARNYFIGESDVDEFYRHLTIISEKNFNQNGQPELTKEQFELLRRTIYLANDKQAITNNIYVI